MPNRPKGKLFALLAIFVAIGLVTATGAFSTVTAQRTVTVDTAGDSAALLQLQGNATSGNGAYVDASGSEIVIDLSSTNLGTIGAGSSGVNVNATTNISHMITVTNNGATTVNFYVTVGTTPAGVAMDFYDGASTGTSIVGSGNAVSVASGTSTSVGLSLDLDGDPGNFNSTVTFHAESQ